MSLTQAARMGSITLLLFLAAAVFLGGNPRTSYAEPLGADIVCRVFTILTNLGDPIPVLNGGMNCPDQPPPPPPPPPAPVAACSNDLDDDADSFIDENDPNCHTDGDPANTASYDPNRGESGTLPACWNNQDDDGDGKYDFPNDPGCTSATDADETDEGGGETPPQCSNTTDDDGDTLVDAADPGCHTDFNAGNSASYDPDLSNEAASAPASAQCSDGSDNDGDGKVDSADPACHTDFNADNSSSYDASRTDESTTPPQCSDGTDNDGDGKVDSADPGCSGGASDNDETDASGGSGNTSTPTSSGGSSSSHGGGGSSGGGGLPAGTTLYTSTSTGSGVATGLVLGTSTAFSTTIDSCDRYLTAFIREGKENDPDQVKRLQRFLKDFEGASISETGTYDKATLGAVHTFQSKYAADILTPWGIGESTGYVYLTTRKKVNEIFCGYTKTFFLTVEEQQKIESARAGASVSPSSPEIPAPSRKPTVPPSSAPAKTETTTTPEPQGQSPLERTLRFLRGIFDR